MTTIFLFPPHNEWAYKLQRAWLSSNYRTSTTLLIFLRIADHLPPMIHSLLVCPNCSLLEKNNNHFDSLGIYTGTKLGQLFLILLCLGSKSPQTKTYLYLWRIIGLNLKMPCLKRICNYTLFR